MRTKASPWVWYAVVIAAVALVSYAIYRFSAVPAGDEDILPPVVTTEQEEPEEVDGGLRVSGGELVERDPDGNIIWKLKAKGELTYDEEAGLAQGKDVAFAVELADGKGFDINAPVFEISYPEGVATFTGGMKVVGREPETTFEAPRAEYNISERIISASEGVKGILPEREMQFEAETLDYDIMNEALVAGGDVVVTQGAFEARADEVTVDLRKRQTHWQGNVRMAWRR